MRVNRNGIAILKYNDGLSYRISDRSKEVNSKRGNERIYKPSLEVPARTRMEMVVETWSGGEVRLGKQIIE